MSGQRSVVRWGLLALGAGLFALAACLRSAGGPVLINRSASAPRGIYLRTGGDFQVGDRVAACLPEAPAALARRRGYLRTGACPGSVAPVLKRVLATAGAWVEHTGSGLVIDGQPVVHSRPRHGDRVGRRMPLTQRYPYRVPAGSVLLVNPHPDSFDGRYFGPIPREAVRAVYRPLWTWD